MEQISSLPEVAEERFLSQLLAIDSLLFKRQQELIFHPPHIKKEEYSPILGAPTRSQDDYETGLQLLRDGKVGCLLLAGGQGSRLGFEGPKGAFPISKFCKKSLFQIFAEKTAEVSSLAGRDLPLAVMTSPENHLQTVAFFENKAFFGLRPSQVFFFMQKTLPLLNEEGNLFLEAPGVIAKGPDGNGGALKALVESGIFSAWMHKGIEFVHVLLVDNPLANPFDPYLVGFHKRRGGDVASAFIEKEHKGEKVGVFAQHQGKMCVLEYTELPVDSDAFPCANIGFFSFAMSFIKKISEVDLPLHVVKREVKCLTKEGQKKQVEAYKFEWFIFDVLPFAKGVDLVRYPRQTSFAPLKNREGKWSLPDVQERVQQAERLLFEEWSGKPPPNRAFELSASFYYKSPEREGVWKGRALPEKEYIEF